MYLKVDKQGNIVGRHNFHMQGFNSWQQNYVLTTLLIQNSIFFLYAIATSPVGQQIFATDNCSIAKDLSTYLNVVIREDEKISPSTDVNVKTALYP